MLKSYLPALVFLLLGIGIGTAFTLANNALGPKRPTSVKREPYESGLPSDVRKSFRFGISFYLIAMLFILFDIEAAFLYPWAVIYRDATRTSSALAWFVFAEMLLFILLLGVGYVYVWKKRAFDWK